MYNFFLKPWRYIHAQNNQLTSKQTIFIVKFKSYLLTTWEGLFLSYLPLPTGGFKIFWTLPTGGFKIFWTLLLLGPITPKTVFMLTT